MDNSFSSNSRHRPHLTKGERLPACFKDVEKVIKSVKSCQGNFKTVLANSRFRGAYYKKVYSLTLNVLQHYDYIQKIIDKLQLMEKEQMLRREIASILIYEVLFGNGSLKGESKAVVTIQRYNDDIMRVHQDLQYSDVQTTNLKVFKLPRYARVHTLVTTVPYVIKDLESCGYQQITYSEDISEEKYVELISSLDYFNFVIDLHFKDLLVFIYYENLTNLDLYQKGHIILQDKSSYIPVQALNPEPGSAVLDACAAPGMKSIHIAAKMENKGVLIACERDKDRFETLKHMLDYGSVKISKMFCKDFKLIDPNDQAYSSIDYILLDPSCSGSGMVNRMDEVTDTEDSKNKERLQKLAGFQIVLLKHALKFPAVKRVVYSTCSIHEEENEYVVHEALNAFSYAFKLVPVMPEWSVRGLETYEHGNLCLRTIPEKHLTNGFFVAAFERLQDSEVDEMNLSRYKESKIKNETCDNSSIYIKKRKMKDRDVRKDMAESSRHHLDNGSGEQNYRFQNTVPENKVDGLNFSKYKESKTKNESHDSGSTYVKKRKNKDRKDLAESSGHRLNNDNIVEQNCPSQTIISENNENSGVDFSSLHNNKDNRSENKYQYDEQSLENIPQMSSKQKKSKKHKHENSNLEMIKNEENISIYLEESTENNCVREKKHKKKKHKDNFQGIVFSHGDEAKDLSQYEKNSRSISEIEKKTHDFPIKSNQTSQKFNTIDRSDNFVENSAKNHKKKKHNENCMANAKYCESPVLLNTGEVLEDYFFKKNIAEKNSELASLQSVDDSLKSPTKHKKRKKDKKHFQDSTQSVFSDESYLLKGDKDPRKEYDLDVDLEIINRSNIIGSTDHLGIDPEKIKKRKKHKHSSDYSETASGDNYASIGISDDLIKKKHHKKVKSNKDDSNCGTDTLSTKHKKRKKHSQVQE